VEDLSIFEQDTVMGTFTHRDTYIKTLQDSIDKFLYHVPFLTIINDAPINRNMELLRQKFIQSGKRFWVFLDDDIQFLNSNIIKNAVRTLVLNKYACVSTYSTYNSGYLTIPYNPNDGRLTSVELAWATGYFMMIDSWKVGHVIPDMNLPYPNALVDVSYSMEIRKNGFKIGISPDYIYHFAKEKKTPHDQRAWEEAEKYMHNKYGDFYAKSMGFTKCIIE
jgi:GT2 family glycosyltransferase